MHARQQIREAFVTALAGTGVETQNGRVFSVYDGILPLFSVYSREEAIETDNNQGRIFGGQKRTVSVVVEIYDKVQAGIDDALDALSVTVEQTIFMDLPVRDLVRCLDLATTEIEVDKGGENPLGVMTMTFECQYMTDDGFPEVIT